MAERAPYFRVAISAECWPPQNPYFTNILINTRWPTASLDPAHRTEPKANNTAARNGKISLKISNQ